MQKTFSLGFAALLLVASLAVLPSTQAAPAITGVTPSTVPTNGGVEITINGNEFAEGVVVEVDTAFDSGPESSSTRARITSVTATQIKAVVPPSPIDTAPGDGIRDAGTVGLRVINPNGQSASFTGLLGYSNAVAPTVTGISPTSGPSNGGQTVEITGTGFAGGFQNPLVTFSSIPAIVVSVTTTKIVAITPPNAPATATVNIVNPDGRTDVDTDGVGPDTAGCTNCYAWTDANQPIVTLLEPPQGPVIGGTSLAITGSNFAAGAKVFFTPDADCLDLNDPADLAASSVAFTSSTQLVAVTPNRASGAALVCVQNPDGDVNLNPLTFSYLPATGSQVADLVSVNPAKGPVYGGTFVNLVGTGFHTGSNAKPTVAIKALDCASANEFTFDSNDVLVQSGSSILVRMPSMAATGGGVRAISVSNPNGAVDCLETAYDFVLPIEITDLSHKTGPSSGGLAPTADGSNDPITISGKGFTTPALGANRLRVFFGQAEAYVCTGAESPAIPGCMAPTNTEVRAIPPPQAVPAGGGHVHVVVSHPDGRTASFWKYTYTAGPAPTIDHLNSATATGATNLGAGSTNGGAVLTINSGATAARFAFGFDPDGPGPLQPAIPTVTIGSLPVIVMKSEPGAGYPATTEHCDTNGPDGTGDACRYPQGLVASFKVLVPPHATPLSNADVLVTNPDGRSDQSADANERVTTAHPADAPAFGQTETVDGNLRGPTWGGTPVLLDGTPGSLDNLFTEAPAFYFDGAAANLDAAKPTVKIGTITVPANQVFVVADAANTGVVGLTCDVGPCILFFTPPYTSGAGALDQVITVTNPNGQSTSSPASEAFDYDFAGTAGLQATPPPGFSGFPSATGPANGGNIVRIQATNVPVTRDGTTAHTFCVDTAGDDVLCDDPFDGNRIATPLPTVLIDGVAATQVRVVDDADPGVYVYARVPGHAPTEPSGVPVVLRNPDGQSVAAGSYVYTNTLAEAPVLSTVSLPTASFVGGSLVTLTGDKFPVRALGTATRDADNRACTGNPVTDTANGFDWAQVVTPRPAVTFGGTPALFVCVLTTGDIRAIVPPHAAGDAAIQVNNPDGDATSLGGAFRYLPVVPIPTALSITTSPGNGGGQATLTGPNFAAGDQVYFQTDQTATGLGGLPALAGTITATSAAIIVPAGLQGPADVKIVDANGQMGTLDTPMNYLASALPQAKGVSPVIGSVNGGTPITIEGSGFASGAVVRFDNDVGDVDDTALRSVTVSPDGKRLTFVTPNFMRTESRSFGPIDILVCNPIAGTAAVASGATSLAGCHTGNPNALLLVDAFGYAAIAGPTITGVSPGNGTQAGGKAVTITGTGFLAGSAVRFDGVDATDVVVVSSTQITAKTPAHAAGPVTVTVTVAGQTASLANGFTYDGLVTSSSSSSTSASSSSSSPTSGTLPTSGTSPTSGLPTSGGLPTAAEIEAANKAIELTVTREGDTNVLRWDLPSASELPGLPVAGVQIHASNSPYTLLETFPAGSAGFEDGTYTHTGSAAQASTKYLVTMYYGATSALGFFDGSNAPDTVDYPGLASTDNQPGDDDGGLPTWAIVLIVLGILFLIVLVVVLIARGRQDSGSQQQSQQAYAGWQQDEQQPAGEAGGEVHQARCPACATSFTVTGTKPVITVCPGCGKKGILR